MNRMQGNVWIIKNFIIHLFSPPDRRVLHTAALFGHVDIIRELLKAGAAKDARDRMGRLSYILVRQILNSIECVCFWEI